MVSRTPSQQWQLEPAPSEHAHLLDLLAQLKVRAETGASLPSALADEAWQAGVAALGKTRQQRHRHFEDILTAVYRLAAHDFGYRMPDPCGDDISDYIVHGINMLAQVLEDTTVSRRELDAIVDTMIDPLLVVGPEGISHANAAAARELGVPRAQLRGHALERFVQLDDATQQPLTYARLQACCQGGSARDLAVKLLRDDGRRMLASVNASSLSDDKDTVERMVLVVRDMTEVVGLVEAARQAVTEKSQFVAAVSHEMRTPMHGVIAMTSLMLRGALPTVMREQLEVVQRSAGALVTLVDDLLELSKLDAGKTRIEQRTFSLPAVARDVVGLLEGKAGQSGLRLTASIDQALPAALIGDPDRLRQVITNLCGNAIKFTEKGSAELRLTQLSRMGQTVVVRVEVVDTGIGIPDAELASVFEPFVQRHGVRRFGGTGLGLAISRHLVQLMGTDLHCESVAGRGSRFWFDLTLQRPVDEAAAKCSSSPPSLRPDARILVADDEPNNRALLVAMLEGLGIQADAVGDGQAAVDAVRAGHYALVLLDWEMPALNGPDAARAIRHTEAHGQHVPIVCLTGHPAEVVESAADSAGMDGCLSKPFMLGQLSDVLARWLGDREAIG